MNLRESIFQYKYVKERELILAEQRMALLKMEIHILNEAFEADLKNMDEACKEEMKNTILGIISDDLKPPIPNV